MTDTDYASWLTKQQAAEAIGVTTKTVERLAQDGKVQQARWRRQGRGPELAVYHPDDVARIAQERHPGLPPFVLPVGTPLPANGNGHGALNPQSLIPTTAAPGDDVLRLLFAAALRAVSEKSETPTVFVTIDEAAGLSGLSRTYVRRLIAAGTLQAVKDRGWKIRRRDVEAL